MEQRGLKSVEGDAGTKTTRPTSKRTMEVERPSASSLFGRSDEEGVERERKGSAECFAPVF